jgi:hypothetical protein
MLGLYQALCKKAISRREFPSPASGFTSAVKRSADYIPATTHFPSVDLLSSDLTPLFDELREELRR